MHNNGLQRCTCPNSRTCAYVTSHGKRAAGVIEVIELRWGDEPGVYKWTQSNHGHPFPAEVRRERCEDRGPVRQM
jgi:hypothetical protein